MKSNPRVLILYSYDDDEHTSWVSKLAADLRRHLGIDVVFDKWDLRYGYDISRFIEQELDNADICLCICSSNYCKKVDEGIGGAGYEKMVIAPSLLQKNDSKDIIPIIRNNSEGKMPKFLGSRRYIDFSSDENYYENLNALAKRIHDVDILQKPRLGENPFSNETSQSIIHETLAGSVKYHNPQMEGGVCFDFTNNSGRFLIGTGEYEFLTSWSECNGNSIYAYKDAVYLIGYLPNFKDMPAKADLCKFDFSSRSRAVKVGEVVVWMNKEKRLAVTKIKKLLVASRGAAANQLEFDYKIFD